MGKTIRDEDLRLNIIINGDAGRKAITNLESTCQDAKIKLDSLIAEQKKLESQGKTNTSAYKKLTTEIDKQSAALVKQREQLQNLIRQQSLEKMTLNELLRHQRMTMSVFRNVEPGTEQWKKLRLELQQVDARIKNLKTSAADSGSVVSRFAGDISRYFGAITAAFASFSFATMGLRKARIAFLEYDEALTDAQKTTNTTKTEIREISEELKKIDTRTTQNKLLDITRVAGKLGIEGVQNIEGFVRAGDKIGVALARDLGDNTEAAITQIGKLVDIFHLKEQFGIEQSMLKVGSAINELGMASTAAEGYIVEFAKRAAGTAPNVDMSIQSILGLGATLDKFGQTAETAGTAYGQMIMGMYKRTEVFAKTTKMSLGDFRKLMNEDMNEAFIRVLEGMGKSGNGMQSIVNALNSMGFEGQRVQQVMGTLAKNADELRRQQDLANRSFEEGTSVLNEFKTKNESATAVYEKQKEALTEQARILGETLNPAFTSSTSVSIVFLKAITLLVKGLCQTKGAIITLSAVYASYLIGQKADVAVKKLQDFWRSKHRVTLMREVVAIKDATTATKLMAIAQNLLVGNFKAAAVAAKAFFASMGAIGWVVAGISAATSAFMLFANQTSAAAKFQKLLSDHMRDAASEAAKERTELDRLKGKLEGCKVGTKEYNSAKQEIIDKFGKYDSTLKDETLTVQTLRDKYNSLTTAIMQSANTRQYNKFIEAKQTSFDEQFGETSNKLWEHLNNRYYTEKASKYYNQIMTAFFGGQTLDGWLTTGSSKTQKLVGQLKALRAEQDKSDKEAKARFNIKGTPVPNTDTDEPKPKPKPKPKPTEPDDDDKWSLDKDETYLTAKLKLKEQYQQGVITSETEFNEALRNLEVKALEDHLAKNIENGADRLKLQEQLADKKLEHKKVELQQEEEVNRLLQQSETDKIRRENADYEQKKKKYAGNAAALEAVEKAHQRNITKIRLDQIGDRQKQEQDQYDLEKRILKNRHRQKLIDFKGSADERRRLKQEQMAEEARLDADHLTRLAAQLQTLVDSGMFDGIQLDMSLLSEEEKRDLLNRIEEVTEALGGLKTTAAAVGYSFEGEKTDLLGLGKEDWTLLIENIKKGKFGLYELQAVMTTIGDATKQATQLYASYDRMMSAKENAQFKKYQKNQEKKKKENQELVDAGLMTEEQAHAEEERMQAEADAKQEELQIKQAKRQRAMSITEAIVNTALGVTKTLASWGLPWGLIPAALMLAMGTAQVALISSTPLAGAEEGGYVVERQQDGKKYNARYSPDKRGFISSPTVLVSENGREYVIPSDAMNNPSMIPVLDSIESARRQGTLGSFDFNAVYRQQPKAQGFANGGSTGPMPTFDTTTSTQAEDIDAKTINLLYGAVIKLIKKLDDPILTYITIYGKNGLAKKMEEYNKNKDRGQLG